MNKQTIHSPDPKSNPTARRWLVATTCVVAGMLALLVLAPRFVRTAQAAASPPAAGALLNFSCLGGPVSPVDRVELTGEDTVALGIIQKWARGAWSQVRPRSVRPEQVEARSLILAEEADLLYAFTTNYPSSAWTPAIQVKLGQHYRLKGRFSLALELWDAAWRSTKLARTGSAKVAGDFAVTRYLNLLSSLGRYEKLTELFAETTDRDFPFGADSQVYAQAMEAHQHMGLNPSKSYRCGTYALGNVATRLYQTNSFARALAKVPSPATGFTLQQLAQFSDTLNLGLVPVHWGENQQLVVPSVIHWRGNHYAAITEQHGNLFKVVDPTFGKEVMLRAEDIRAEASGYFLVPASRVPARWREVGAQERSTVYGRGYFTVVWDHVDEPSCPRGSGPGVPGATGTQGCSTCTVSSYSAGDSVAQIGMPSWQVSEPGVNLWLFDTPLSYQPALGWAMDVKLSYRQRGWTYGMEYNVGLYYGFTTGAGKNWSLPWRTGVGSPWGGSDLGYDIDGNASVELATPAGASFDYAFTGSNALSAVHYFSNTKLEMVVNPTTEEAEKYVLHFSDGSRDEYGFVATNGYGNVYRFALTSHFDSHGHETKVEYFDYNPELGETIIKRIIDPDGHALTFDYFVWDPFGDGSYVRSNNVSQITDWTGRNAKFRYDTNNLQLIEIVDAAGLTNQIAYNEVHWATNLVTPYGTTAFEHFAVRANHTETRFVTITEPNGAKQRYLYESSDENLTGPLTNAVDPLGNGYSLPSGTPYSDSFATHALDRNTYHWDARNFATLSTDFKNDPGSNLPTQSDYVKARGRHWTGTEVYGGAASHTLGAERAVSPDGSTEGQITWYNYEGKASDDYQGTQILPAVIARVMPDTSTWYEYFERNDIGRVTKKVDKWVEGGSAQYRTNTFVYDSNDIDLVRSYGPDGGLTAGYAYDASYLNQPIRATNALNEVTYYTYDAYDRLVTTTAPSGLVSSNTYGSDGYLQKTVDSYGSTAVRTNQYTWLYNYPRVHIDERGLSTTNTYDGLGRLTQVDYPDGTYEQNIFTIGSPYANSTGGLTLLDRTGHRDRMGFWTYYQWTANRQLASVIDPRSVVTAYSYCNCGSLDSVTRAYGTGAAETTSYVYDQSGKRLATIAPDTTGRTNQYDLPGRLTITSDALGNSTNYYDNLSRLVTVSNAFGRVQALTYDADDHVVTATDANGVTVTNYYDGLDRLLARDYPDGGAEDWSFTANVSGPTGYTNQLTNVWLYAYDPAGRKTNEVAVGVYTNKFTYAPASDLLTLTDGRSYTTTWKYDEYGRVTNKLDQASVEILRYKYDFDSRLTNRWSKAMGDTKYKYDVSGNLTNVDYPSGTTDLTFAYDLHNRVTNMVDAIGTTKYTYYAGGQLKTEDGPWSSDTVSNVFNSARMRSDLILQQPTGNWTNRLTYDAGHRLSTVVSPAGTFTYTYRDSQPSTLIKKLSLPNTSYITNDYDSLGRLLFTKLNNSSHTTLDKSQYVYNQGNQRTKHTRTDDSFLTFSYDDIGELTVVRATNSSNALITGETKGYAYDAGWNLARRTNNSSGSTTTFTVDSKNQLTAGPTSAYAHDDNGNLTSSSSGGVLYSYDAENQLTAVESAENTRTWFTYDGRGRLRQREEYYWYWDEEFELGYWVSYGAMVRYVYDGMRVIQERDGGNTPSVSYTRGNDLSGTLEGAGGIGGLLARSHGYSSGNWSTHNSYHADGGGNITYLVNSSQTVAASYRYDGYGNLVSGSGSLSAANVYRFSSKERIEATGQYYYGYRFYDPNLQRWLNRDPQSEIGSKNLDFKSASAKIFVNSPFTHYDPERHILIRGQGDGKNPYAFLANEPLRHCDPDGRQIFRLIPKSSAPLGGPRVFGPCWFVSQAVVNAPGNSQDGTVACIWTCFGLHFTDEYGYPRSEITVLAPGSYGPCAPPIDPTTRRCAKVIPDPGWINIYE